MFNLFKKTAAIALIAVGFATSAGAASLQLSTSFNVSADPAAPNTFPVDNGGLDGSSMTLDFVFADGTTFADGYAAAESASLSVAGASVASSNGSFAITDPVGLFARAASGGLGTPFAFFGTTNQFPFAVPGIFKSVKFDAGGSVDAADGDLLTLDILQDVAFTFARPTSSSQLTNFKGQQYTANDIQVSAQALGATPVPLPAGFPLLLAGLGGLAALRRRRAAAA